MRHLKSGKALLSLITGAALLHSSVITANELATDTFYRRRLNKLAPLHAMDE